MKVIAFFVICSLAAFAGITPGNADNVRRAGDTMSGNLDMGTNSLLNIYRATITGPTNTYAVTTAAWPAGAAVGSATNITGTLANDTDVFAFVAHVWPATNIGGAWLFGPAISNLYAGDGSGETNDIDLVVSWTNYPGMSYWLALTNAALAGAEIYTNVAASPFTFAGVADYDAALDTSRTLYVVTNATDTALVIGGTVNMGGNAITNLASPTVASGAANKAYVDAATNAMDDAQWIYKSPVFPDEYQVGGAIPNGGNGEFVGYRVTSSSPQYNAQYMLGYSPATRTNLTVELIYSFPVQVTTQILGATYSGYGLYYYNNATKVAISTPGFLGASNWTNASLGQATSIIVRTSVNVPPNKVISMWYKSLMEAGGTGYFNAIRYRYR